MPRSPRGWLVSLWLSLAVVSPCVAGPDVQGSISTGAGSGTDHKPQSKLWFNDGAWWAVLYDGSSNRIWKLDGGTFVKQTYPDAAIDSRASARCDVLWDGTSLYVLVFHPTLPRFVKYAYDNTTQTYQRQPGFPIDLPIAGLECMVLDKDSTGRVWASFEINHEIRAIWTTTADHLVWNTTGVVVQSAVGSDDITSTVAFGGDRIGVLWSDQGSDGTWEYGFRVHRDSDPPEAWQPIEIIDTGSQVDDHMNIKADYDGRLWFAGKNVSNSIQVYTRAPAGGWSRIATNINQGNCTRPSVVIDDAQNLVHVFYTDWTTTPNPIKHVSAPRSTMVFGAPELYLTPGSTSALNDVTSAKHHAAAGTGIAVIATAGSTAYWGYSNLDSSAPVATAVAPADESTGVPLQPVVQMRVADAGMGVRRSSITMSLNGSPVVPTVAGTASEYLVSYQPPTPLAPGTVYTVVLDAQDAAYPPHSTALEVRFKTEILPGPLAKKFNFQPASGAQAPGYDLDAGAGYSLERGWGWDRSVTMKRAGVHADVRLDTYVERSNSSSRAKWSYDVANGVYRVTFVAGAPAASGKHRVEVEGQVLIANLTTAAGQFLTIADYDVTVQDGRLDVRIGGAGSSSKTQLCYFELEYRGDAPPPPPPGGAKPMPVANLDVAVLGSDLELQWEAVSRDTTGELTPITRYHVYRGANARFLPDRIGRTNRIGIVSGTRFVDLGALGASGEQYYLVTAENANGLESSRASNLAMRRRVAVDPSGAPSRTVMLALPHTHAFTHASGLAVAMNASPSSGPVQRLAVVDRSTQARREWARTGSTWSGTDFSLQPGDAVEITVGSALQWNLLGAEAAAPAYNFAFHAATGNVNWLSLPQNCVYGDARSLVEALNGGPATGPVTKVAWLDPASGRMESWLWYAGAWRGNNFPLATSQGVAVLVAADLTWSPALRQP